MKTKKLLILLMVLFSLDIYSNEKQLEENLQYFKEIYTQANAQYEYEKELGFDIDVVVSQVKQKYSEQCNIKEDINSDILVTCYGEILNKVQKIPNNHFAIYNSNKGYGYKYWLWNYSDIIFEKRGDKFYCVDAYRTKIKKGAEYTGDVENLFKFRYKGDELYRYGLFSDNWVYETNISVDNKEYLIHLFQLPSLVHKTSGIGMKTTDKTFYICFNDFTFYEDDLNKSSELNKKLNEYLKSFDENEYENIIVDIRGNHGGMERSFYPFLQRLAAGRDYVKQQKFQKKLESIKKGHKRYYSDYINQNFLDFMKTNPGSYNEKEKNKLEKSQGFYYEQNNDDFYDFDCNFKGKLIILMNYWTASAAELFITESYIFDNVILLGCNTSGCFDFGGNLEYRLPNSDIFITLPSDSYKEVSFLQNNSHWHGDYKGFYPDYWVTDGALLRTLEEITSDKKLKQVLKNIGESFCE